MELAKTPILTSKTTSFKLYDFTLREWRMDSNCGSSIGRYDSKAGMLQLNASDLYHYRTTRECQVTIEAERFSEKKTKLAFFFSSFRLSNPCLDTNLTIADGYPGFRGIKSVVGLPSGAFCGHNTTLEKPGHVFVSLTNSLVLTYRWRIVDGMDRPPNGSFTLKFFAFYDTPCNEDGSDVDPCSSKRCMYTDFRCHDALNACGDKRGGECSEEGSGILDTITRFFEDYGAKIFWVVFISILLIVVLKKLYYLKKKYGSLRRIPIIRELFPPDTDNEHRNSSRRNSQVLTADGEAQEMSLIRKTSDGEPEVNQQTEINTLNDTNTGPGNNAFPHTTPYPSAQGTTFPSNSEPFQVPQGPPPSYDAVVNNEQNQNYKSAQ